MSQLPSTRRVLSTFTRWVRLARLRDWLADIARTHARRTATARLLVEGLEVRVVPVGRPFPSPVIFASGTDTLVVKAYAADTGTLNFEQAVYAPSFTGGVRVGAADFNRDGYPDLVVSPGGGGGAACQGSRR